MNGNRLAMKRKLNKIKKCFWGYFFIAPAMIGFFLFMAWPMLNGIIMSFKKVGLRGTGEWIGLKNYMALVNDVHFIKAIINTGYYTVGIILIGVPLALLLAIILNQKLKGISFYRLVYYMPVITMMIAVSVVWKGLLSTNNGLINYIIGLAGISKIPWLTDPKWAMPALILMSIWKGTGFNMIVFLGALQNIPKTYYEASTIDGANAFQRFKNITLPLLSPAILFVVITTTIHSFQIFEQAYILTQGGPQEATTTIVYYIYQNTFEWFKPGYACAQATILFVMLLIITALQFWFQRKWVHYD
ncbi:MAG: sugar ABC transporter permease [Halanaerobiales bacterium]|nr:sugar ABC transporter permease [Halanaerobiales bacterium]